MYTGKYKYIALSIWGLKQRWFQQRKEFAKNIVTKTHKLNLFMEEYFIFNALFKNISNPQISNCSI